MRKGHPSPSAVPGFTLATISEEVSGGVYKWTRLEPDTGRLPFGPKTGRATELNNTTGIAANKNIAIFRMAGKWWFINPSSASSSGGGGSPNWYGDGSDGSHTVAADDTTLNAIVYSFQMGSDAPDYGFVANDWMHWQTRACNWGDFTIPAGHVYHAGDQHREDFTYVMCSGTLTIGGELTGGGDSHRYIRSYGYTIPSFSRGIGGVGVFGGAAGNAGTASEAPFDEGRSSGDTTLWSGSGGAASGHGGGSGNGGGWARSKIGGANEGDGNAKGWWIHGLPGAATGYGPGGQDVRGGSGGGSGGAGAGQSGDAGSGGGVLIIRAKNIVRTGSGKITCRGGRGLPSVGVAGGSGAGNGGVVLIVCDTIDPALLPPDVAAGVGSAGSGGGTSGTSGGANGVYVVTYPNS